MPTTEKMVQLDPVFHMPALNEFQTALQVYVGPDGKYLIHMADGATGAMVLGFMALDEIKRLHSALAGEIQRRGN